MGLLPKLRTRSTGVLVGLLLLLGSTLVMAPLFLGPRHPQPAATPSASPRPSPTWRNLPTRVPTAPADAQPRDLVPLQRALLRGDLEEAAVLWTALIEGSTDADVELHKAGARLAMLQGGPSLAAERAWHAVGASPTDPQTWSLLGIILRNANQPREAEQALAIAVALDPGLEQVSFSDRWRLALATSATATLANLAGEQQLSHPNSVWLPYYRAEALIADGAPLDAIQLLVPVLSEEPASPALLWYTLGRAYLERGGYAEAATALEAAASRTYQGDTSIETISNDPVRDLNAVLGRSYLGTGRCREAEMIFRRLQNVDPSLGTMVDAAVVCQTPTPTLTPWIPKQIGTVTPRP